MSREASAGVHYPRLELKAKITLSVLDSPETESRKVSEDRSEQKSIRLAVITEDILSYGGFDT
ncbi:hypothetical protein EYF80_010292 [Liparis tanakae]|uniref:Uncharacterized protein n=1 Tax=Liparis tanakae TaxID=230148 RepID=A0A4Z2IP90_9TELE|nr:hypothetical protein EYF80_010292 [Liparis tanakae]